MKNKKKMERQLSDALDALDEQHAHIAQLKDSLTHALQQFNHKAEECEKLRVKADRLLVALQETHEKLVQVSQEAEATQQTLLTERMQMHARLSQIAKLVEVIDFGHDTSLHRVND